jgi:uncharacterized protein
MMTMGRGNYYSWWRRSADKVQEKIFGQGWGAEVAYRLRLQGYVSADYQEFKHPSLPSGKELRIAFASDLHAGPLTDQRVLEKAFEIIKQFKPHLTLLGGDFISLHERHIERLIPFLKNLESPLGILGVMGNHDLWADDKVIANALHDAKVKVLVNESVTLGSPFENVTIFGLDEPGTGSPDASKFYGIENGLNLLLMHSPLGLAKLEGFAFNVAFCGHTHGGQIALPGGTPLVLPRGSGDRQYASGRKSLPRGGAEILISRGIGMSDLPIRLFAPSEVHLCRFVQ